MTFQIFGYLILKKLVVIILNLLPLTMEFLLIAATINSSYTFLCIETFLQHLLFNHLIK